MLISHEKPKCWDRLERAFGVRWNEGMIVTYAGVIHTPAETIAPDFLVHELVHVKQQEGIDPDLYLEKYISDQFFRRYTESRAYEIQAAFLNATIKDPDELFCRKHALAKTMVRNYGDIFCYEDAIIILGL